MGLFSKNSPNPSPNLLPSPTVAPATRAPRVYYEDEQKAAADSSNIGQLGPPPTSAGKSIIPVQNIQALSAASVVDESLLLNSEQRRASLQREVERLKEELEKVSDSEKLVILEMEMSDVLFKTGFHYFLKAILITENGVKGEDNTEVSEVSERPFFQRNKLKLILGAHRSDSIQYVQSPTGERRSVFKTGYSKKVIIEAWAFLGQDLTKMLGSFVLPLEGFEMPSGATQSRKLLIPGAQLSREGKVYGKLSARVGLLAGGKGEISIPPLLQLPKGSVFQGAPVAVEPMKRMGNASFEGNDVDSNSELQSLLIKEHAEKSENLKRAHEDLAAFTKMNEKLVKENAQLRMELEGAEKEISIFSTDEFTGMSVEELTNRLRTSLSRYRAERSRAAEMKEALIKAEEAVAQRAALEAELTEVSKQYQLALGQLEQVKSENEKTDTYKETIIAQEQVIARLEKVIHKSVKDIKHSQNSQIELEKLKNENRRLKEGAIEQRSALINHSSKSTNDESDSLRFEIARAKDRIAALERQLVEAAKAHARQLADIQFK